MAFVPSIRLSGNLEMASTGVWPEALSEGAALVCKIPETAIKALHAGATCSFLLGLVRVQSLDILCLGLRVDDEPEHPFMVMLPSVDPEEAPVLEEVLTAETITLHCLNELNHPMLDALCVLARQPARAAADALRASSRWFLTGDSSQQLDPEGLSRALNYALDRFARFVVRTPEDPLADDIIMAADLPLTLEIRPSTEVFEVTPTISDGPFVIRDASEGLKFERQVHLTIDAAFPGRSCRSPQVVIGRSIRELTDVLAFDDSSITVVQAKALAVLNVAADRPSSRRAATIEKDIETALSQLSGALKNIRSDAHILTREGHTLNIPNRKEAPAHGIVVVSEMYAFVDWKRVAIAATEASESERRKALIHVMDLQELSAITSRCPDSRAFFTRLVQRWLQVAEKGTSYIRTKVPDTVVRPNGSWRPMRTLDE